MDLNNIRRSTGIFALQLMNHINGEDDPESPFKTPKGSLVSEESDDEAAELPMGNMRRLSMEKKSSKATSFHTADTHFDEDDDDDNDDEFDFSDVLDDSSSGQVRRKMITKSKRDYAPVMWDTYFETKHDIKLDSGDLFTVYECGTEGPVLLFLHGGGFSALSWALLSSQLTKLVKCRCVAVDLRGHGDTVTSDEKDLSAEKMSSDVGHVVEKMFPNEAPPIILVGHSMGGAIAVHTAVRGLIPTLIGLTVIDVVEGTALDALTSMQSFLRGRPKTFDSMDKAIEWAVRSGQIQNIESAKVSMVGQLKRQDTNETSSVELDHQTDHFTIQEEEEVGASHPSPSPKAPSSNMKPPSQSHKYTWRINLCETEVFWKGWFEGLSQKFLSCSAPKVLILAGPDRLDKDLTIGQMEGKFQMNLLPQCGHAVHEDVPDKVAEILASFMLRHRVTEAIGGYERSLPGC